MLLQVTVLDIIQTVREDNVHKDNVFCNIFIICFNIIGSVYLFALVAIFHGLRSQGDPLLIKHTRFWLYHSIAHLQNSHINSDIYHFYYYNNVLVQDKSQPHTKLRVILLKIRHHLFGVYPIITVWQHNILAPVTNVSVRVVYFYRLSDHHYNRCRLFVGS